MRVEYSKRALADINRIATYYRTVASEAVVAEIEDRIRDVIQRIAELPDSAPQSPERPGLRAALLIRYPFRIFYRVVDGRIQIVHIRHTARRSFASE